MNEERRCFRGVERAAVRSATTLRSRYTAQRRWWKSTAVEEELHDSCA